jgi:hypothetical protein
MIKLIIIISIYFIFSGCNDASVNNKKQFDYSIDQKLSCFCTRAGVPVRLFVSADTIADALIIKENLPLPKDEWKRYRTVKDLFDEIAKWDTLKYTVNVSFDPEYNYPAYIYVNPKPIFINDTIIQIIADADFSYSTSNYVEF